MCLKTFHVEHIPTGMHNQNQKMARSENEGVLRGDLKDDTVTACAGGAHRGRAVEIASFVEDQTTSWISSGVALKEVEHAVRPASVRLGR